MKKTLAILLALLMVCSALAATLSVSANDATDPYKALLDELGLTTYVPAVDTAPVLDGVVNNGEYSYSKTWAPEEIYGYGTEIQSGVDEYMAHDANYIYYAVVFTQAEDNRALQWQFQPTNTFEVFNSKDNLRTTLFQRITWQLRYQADGTTTVAQDPTWNYAIEDAAPQVGEGLDLEYAATKTAENVKTYEIKLAKAYIAGFSGCEVADVNILPYFTYFHSVCALGHNYTTEETEAIKALGATRADTGLLYRFMVLEDAPAADEPVAINVEEMPGYTPFYAGAPIATAPVQDGVINDGEYSVSRELKPYTANKGEVDLEAYTNVTTEYVAYDADYIYYAYTNAMQYSAGAQLKLRLVHDYVIGDTLKTFQAHRQLEADEAIQLTLGTGAANSASEIPEGKAAPTADEFVTFLSHSGTSYTPAVVEMKISRAYLAAQMGLENASDVTKFTYSTYGTDTVFAAGADWTYLHLDHLLTAEQIEWLVAQGVTTPLGGSTAGDQVSRLFNMIVLGEDPNKPITNLADLYGATYVGAALSADAAKPVQDGKLTAGEYQIMFDGGEAFRAGVPAELIAPVKQYIAHDADYIYVAFEFVNGKSNTRGRLYWNVSFIDSFDFDFVGGTTVADAFKQNGNAINAGWNFGGEVKEDITEGYSDRNNAVPAGKVAPVLNEDFFVAIGRDTYTGEVTTNRQVYEFKVSKAWYAAQAGLESAADVRELAWVVLGEEINTGCSSYTQIGHYVTPEERAYLLEAYGVEFKPAAGNSHPYDNQMLPLLFVLDADPEGDAAAAPTEEVVPAQTWTSYVPAPVDPDQPGEGGDQPGGDQPGGDQPGGDVVTTEPTTTAPSTTEAETTAAASTAKATTTAEATTAAETEAAKKGCKGSIAISALVLLPTLAGGALLAKRRRED